MIFAIFLISQTISAENLKCSECHSIVFSSNQIDRDGAKCFEGSPKRESESKHIKFSYEPIFRDRLFKNV